MNSSKNVPFVQIRLGTKRENRTNHSDNSLSFFGKTIRYGFGSFMHCCDSNHEITQTQQEEKKQHQRT